MMRTRPVLSLFTAAAVAVSPIVVPATVAPVAVAAPSSSPDLKDNGGDMFLYKLGQENGSPTCKSATTIHPFLLAMLIGFLQQGETSAQLKEYYPDLSEKVDRQVRVGMGEQEKKPVIDSLARSLQAEGFTKDNAQTYASGIVEARIASLRTSASTPTTPSSGDSASTEPMTRSEAHRWASEADKKLEQSGRPKKSTYYESLIEGSAISLGGFDKIRSMADVDKQRLWDASRANDFKAYKKVMQRVLNRIIDPSSGVDTSKMTPRAVKYVADVQDKVNSNALSVFSFSFFQESLWFNDRQSFFTAIESGELTKRLSVQSSYRCVDYLIGNTTAAPIEAYNQRLNEAMSRITIADVWGIEFTPADGDTDTAPTTTTTPTPTPVPTVPNPDPANDADGDSQSSSQGNMPIMGIVLVVAALAAALGFIGSVMTGALGPLQGLLPGRR